MTEVAAAADPPATDLRPSFWSVAAALAGAWLLTGVGAALLTTLVEALAYEDGPPLRPQSVLFLVPTDDVWGWLADAPVVLTALVVFIALAERSLRRVTGGWGIDRRRLAVILAGTGALGVLPPGDGGGFLPWLLAAWLVRRQTWRPPQATTPHPRRRAIALAGAAVALLAAAAAPLAYAAQRPLIDAAASCQDDVAGGGDGCSLEEGRRLTVALSFRNAGRVPVRVTGVRLAGLPAGVSVGRLRLIPDEGYARDVRFPLVAAPGSTTFLQARLAVARGTCSQLDDGPLLDAVAVTTAERTQRLPVDEALTAVVECIGR